MSRILIVEDEDVLASTLYEVLADEGYDVLLTRNGADGIDVALRERPDLVLLDWMLPVCSGKTFLERTRAAWPDVRVVVLTSASASNVDAPPETVLLHKPLHLDRLLEAIERVLGTAQAPVSR